MRKSERKLLPPLAVTALIAALLFPGAARQSSASPAASANVVACRVLEAHTSKQLGITVVIFHQQDNKERQRLGTLLREHSDTEVEFQTADGSWHAATVIRLKSCFGRGLLLFPAGSAQLAEGDEFLLKFPGG